MKRKNILGGGGQETNITPINKGNNKRKIITITLGVILVVLLIGASYAVWRYTFTGSANTIETSKIELELLESTDEVIRVENALPMSDEQGKNQTKTFNFAVTTRTKAVQDIGYSLKLEKLTVDSGYTSLNDNQIKVYLTDYNNNQLLSPTLVSSLSNYVLYSKTNSHDGSIEEIQDKYKLRVWIDKDVLVNDWNESTKLQYKFKIGVGESQTTIAGGNSAATMLMSKVGESGLEEVTHPADSTLQMGATESLIEYRFRGGNDVVTNNYVYFNCSDTANQTKDTCELYRIIGIFPTDDGTGKIENRIKLIKADNYGNNYWDSQSSSSGSNNWARPATLNTTFNTTYWGTINEKYQTLVGDTKYYLGGYSDSDMYASVMYGYERKTEGSTYYYTGNLTNWTGKISLMYASDYGYGANSACSESTTLFNYETNSCPDNNWLYLGSTEWLLPQRSSYSYGAFYVVSDGFVSDSSVGYSYAVRPVLYLTSDAEFNDIGDGSVDNPYQLKE